MISAIVCIYEPFGYKELGEMLTTGAKYKKETV
jgi:hypothetical protein